jgi:biopolymer transport protein ExbB/TolQ
VLVLSAYWALQCFLPARTWLSDFFFRRGFVQWATLGVFAFGLMALVRRLGIYLREAWALRNLTRGKPGKPGTSVVMRRLKRFQSYVVPKPPKDTHQYAQSLAESDANELAAGYGAVGDVVQVLPLLGFFGTVLGLSKALYTEFVVGKAAEAGVGTTATSSSFARAIGTAFDTTLLALACTLVMIILQRLLYKREEHVLNGLNCQIDAMAARCRRHMKPDRSRAEWPQAVVDELSAGLEAVCRQAAAEAQRGLATACASASESFRAELASATERILKQVSEQQQATAQELAVALKASIADGIREAIAAGSTRDDGGLQDVIAPLRENAAGIRDLVARIEERNGHAADAVIAAIRDNVSNLGHRLNGLFAQPRRISIIEQPLVKEESADDNPTA